MNRRDVRDNLPIYMLQKGDEFHLPFALGCGGVDLTRARIKTGKEVQGSLAGVLMFDPDWLPRLGGQGRGFARPWLQTGFLVHAQYHFPYPQGAGIQGHNLLDLGCERCIPWAPGRQPQMVAPWFQLVMGQNPLDGLGRDRLHHPVAHQLLGQFRAIPLRQGTSDHIRTLVGNSASIIASATYGHSQWCQSLRTPLLSFSLYLYLKNMVILWYIPLFNINIIITNK